MATQTETDRDRLRQTETEMGIETILDRKWPQRQTETETAS